MQPPVAVGEIVTLPDGSTHAVLDVKRHPGGMLLSASTPSQPKFAKGAFWKLKIKRGRRAEWYGPVWIADPDPSAKPADPQ